MTDTDMTQNTSGMGEKAIVPPTIIDKFNWGAFLCTWIWGIGNKSYITLISLVVAFIPMVGALVNIVLAIWFGIKGNEWAWRNKRFLSLEHFEETQKMWVTIGIILIILYVVFIVVGMLMFIKAMSSIKV